MTKRLKRTAYKLTKKVHMYVGLLVCVQITIYGIAGLNSTFDEAPADREPLSTTTTMMVYAPPAGASDKAIADDLYRLLQPSLAGPVPDWALRRTPEGQLRVNFHSVNGPTHVTVLANQGQIRVERVRNTFQRFINNIHARTFREYTGDWRLMAWTWFNELGIWALLFLSVSGVFIWLASRPRLRLAVTSFGGGLAVFIILWILIR